MRRQRRMCAALAGGLTAAALASALALAPTGAAAQSGPTPGVTEIGPGGTTLHMYKVHDTVTDKDMVAILFVKGDEIVNQMIQ